MFDMHMETEATPERVYLLCKLLSKKKQTAEELKNQVEPRIEPDKSSSYFPTYLKAAKELGLVSEEDGVLVFTGQSQDVESFPAFRRTVNKIVSQMTDTLFFQLTQFLFKKNEEVLKRRESIVQTTDGFYTGMPGNVSDTDIRAWRFWASFLGLGYLSNNKMADKTIPIHFIPNCADFLLDAIHNANIEKGKVYTIDEFIDKIQPHCQIVEEFKNPGHRLGLGFSMALYTLADDNVLSWKEEMDFAHQWSLYPIYYKKPASKITHITLQK